MITNKCECGGELKLKKDFFNQSNPNGYDEMRENFEKEFGIPLPEIKGYNCIVCGQCYDTKFNKEKISIGWLSK